MKSLIIIVGILIGLVTFANTNNFTIKLDQFTLATSQTGLSDTIEVTKNAWTSSDSIHVFAYVCGASHIGRPASFMARDENDILFQEEFENKHLGFRFSFSTSRIDPSKIRYLAMTIGAAASENKMGWKYRMGILKFI